MDIQALHDYTLTIIKEAGERIRRSFFETMEIETKSNANDLVTNIDKEIEAFIVKKIHAYDTSFRILGEEGMAHEQITSLEGVVWMVDPIDGTMNFVRQRRNFAISIAIYEDGVGRAGYIYDVVADELYYAIAGNGAFMNGQRLSKLEPIALNKSIVGINAVWATPNRKIEHEGVIRLFRQLRGTRSLGSATLEIMAVATGRIDSYISLRLSPWDIAAGIIIAAEVGAVASTLALQPVNLLAQDTFIIANPSIHREIVEQYVTLK
ncbi:inositol monophosphatase family protein [Kurthia massiliensis]|uniref:inositol monophosphatase family protein n=1 Tax=Kurthia massiliensis TaxID=1033739 RepID=UPI0002887C2E|nr:inositol monophosphatase family protein [Kurthia massiliensis]